MTENPCDRLRSEVFAVLRRHDVNEQCFAEIAAITQHFKTEVWPPPLPAADAELVERRIDYATGQFHDATRWRGEDAPDGKGSLFDWVCRPYVEALSRTEVSEAMVLVPTVPTQAMYEAAFASDQWGGVVPKRRIVDEIWRSMLAARDAR